MSHSADEDDDGAQVDLATEEAHRRWCRSLPATVAIATEAQSDAHEIEKPGGDAAGIPQIVGRVEASPTGTSVLANRVRKILVNCEKAPPESGVAGQIVIHGRVLRGCHKLRSTPLGNLDQVIRLSEGNFLRTLGEVDQESRISHRLPWPLSQQAL